MLLEGRPARRSAPPGAGVVGRAGVYRVARDGADPTTAAEDPAMSAPTGAATADLAAGMLQIAQQRMLRPYPFHARFVAAWRCQATDIVVTAGVTVEQGTIVLYYQPAFVVACTYAELVGVLLHETHHLLFEHPWLDPVQFPDAQALMLAEEV